MAWTQDLANFCGGVFLTNAIPHFVSGVMGKPFQTPFAKPPGEGFSSATVNVLWGFLNAVIGYYLVVQVGAFDPRAMHAVAAAGLGALVMGLATARMFGRFNGGNAPPGA